MNKEKFPDSPVLIVDDEKNILQSTDFILQSNGINNVECCQESLDVMTRLEKKKYSVVLLDLNMPGIGGEELLPSIRKKHPDTSVIIISGKTYGGTKSYCTRHGAYNFLEKPVEPSLLMDAVNSGLSAVNRVSGI